MQRTDELFQNLMEWKIIRIDKIKQVDGTSCGPIALLFLILLSYRVDLGTFGEEQIKLFSSKLHNFRKKIASSILSECIFFSNDNNVNELHFSKLKLLYDEKIKSKLIIIEDLITAKEKKGI